MLQIWEWFWAVFAVWVALSIVPKLLVILFRVLAWVIARALGTRNTPPARDEHWDLYDHNDFDPR